MRAKNHTVAFSERLIGNGPSSAVTPTIARHVREIPGAANTTPAACDARAAGTWFAERGSKWILGNYGNTLYNHGLAPNAKQHDCMNMLQQKGQMAARSLHPGGVTSLKCDGSVAFVADGVTLSIWQALATRAGGEIP